MNTPRADEVMISLNLPESLCQRIEAAGKDPTEEARKVAESLVGNYQQGDKRSIRWMAGKSLRAA